MSFQKCLFPHLHTMRMLFKDVKVYVILKYCIALSILRIQMVYLIMCAPGNYMFVLSPHGICFKTYFPVSIS